MTLESFWRILSDFESTNNTNVTEPFQPGFLWYRVDEILGERKQIGWLKWKIIW